VGVGAGVGVTVGVGVGVAAGEGVATTTGLGFGLGSWRSAGSAAGVVTVGVLTWTTGAATVAGTAGTELELELDWLEWRTPKAAAKAMIATTAMIAARAGVLIEGLPRRRSGRACHRLLGSGRQALLWKLGQVAAFDLVGDVRPDAVLLGHEDLHQRAGR